MDVLLLMGWCRFCSSQNMQTPLCRPAPDNLASFIGVFIIFMGINVNIRKIDIWRSSQSQ